MNNLAPRLRRGMKIPLFTKASQILSKARMNMLVSVSNAVLSGRVTRGGRDELLISDESLAVQIGQNPPSLSSSSATSFYPFKVYNPTGEPGHTFRVRGGYVQYPTFWTVSSTPTEFDPQTVADDLHAANNTDGVVTESTSEGSDAADLVLDDWDNGIGGHYTFFGVWIEMDQASGDPGVVSVVVNGAFNQLPGAGIKATAEDRTQETNYWPIARIFPAEFDGDDIVSGTVEQFRRGHVVDAFQVNPGRYVGYYSDNRVYMPSDMVFWETDSKYYLQLGPNAVRGYDPTNVYWVEIAPN